MKTSLISSVLASVLLCACGPSSSSSSSAESSAADRDTAVVLLTKEMPVYAPFSQITNLGSCDIEIAEGPCAVTMTGDSISLSHVIYDVSSGALTLSMPQDEMEHSSSYLPKARVKVKVTMPVLRILANYGPGTIRYHGGLTTSSLHIGGMSAGDITFDSIAADTFRFEASGTSRVTLGRVQSRQATLLCYGGGEISGEIEADEQILLDNSGTGQLHLALKSRALDVNSTASGSAELDLEVDQLTLSHQGRGMLTLTGKAREKDIRAGKYGKLNNLLK